MGILVLVSVTLYAGITVAVIVANTAMHRRSGRYLAPGSSWASRSRIVNPALTRAGIG